MRNLRTQFKCVAAIAAAVTALTAANVASATSMIYKATVVTNVKVGNQSFNNASVVIKFTGDTANITPALFTPAMASALGGTAGSVIPSQACAKPGSGYTFSPSNQYFFYLTEGNASVSVTSQGQTVTAKLSPGQVFVALDACNGGIGFGSFTGPVGLEPAYPLAFTLGTAMNVAVGSGLTTPTSMSGNAWSCIGYPPTGYDALPPSPNNQCIDPQSGAPLSLPLPAGLNSPPYALHSNLGDVFIYMPYTVTQGSGSVSICCNHYGTMARGTFTIAPYPNQDDH